MMHTIERNKSNTPEIAIMVDRVTDYYAYLAKDPRVAADYWRFIVHTYKEQGYEQAEFFELMCAADEVIKDLRQEIEGLEHDR